MITSALISQMRREYGDVPKRTRVTKDGDGVVKIFNLKDFPIIEGSEQINISGGAVLIDPTNYSLDDDSGDLTMVLAVGSAKELKSEHKFAHWREKHWNEAVNQGIEVMNARGFFRQTVRTNIIISAGTKIIDAPSACMDVYELLKRPTSGTYSRLPINWSYQQDANKIVLGAAPTIALSAARSHLRKLQTYEEISATVDLKEEWIEPVKKYAGAMFYRSLAGKIAKQGNASIDEGHFSFTNLRTMANDLISEFDNFTTRAKPTRPAKVIQWHIPGGGE